MIASKFVFVEVNISSDYEEVLVAGLAIAMLVSAPSKFTKTDLTNPGNCFEEFCSPTTD